MSNDKEINLNIKMDSNLQQQLVLYKREFDSLKSAINDLSRPIKNLDSDVAKLTASLDKNKEENISVADTIKKVKDGYSAAETVIFFFAKQWAWLKLQQQH